MTAISNLVSANFDGVIMNQWKITTTKVDKWIRVSGSSGTKLDDWLMVYGSNLKPYSRDFLRKLIVVGKTYKLSTVSVGGWRTPRGQCEAIFANWTRAFRRGGERAALSWALKTYGHGRMLHKKYLNIHSGKMSMEEYVKDFLRRNRHKARHDNGRAFDIRPIRPKIEAAIRRTLKEGSPELFTRFGRGIKKESDHYHIQLSPPR